MIDQLETVFDAMADGVFIYDDHEQLIKVNAAGREILGGAEFYRSPASLQKGAERFRIRDLHGFLLSQEQWPVRQLLRGEEFKGTSAMEMLVHTMAGQERFLSLSGSSVRDPQGQIVGGVIIARDVTENRRMEEAKLQSEEMLRVALRNSLISIFRQDLDLRYTWMYNPPLPRPNLSLERPTRISSRPNLLATWRSSSATC